MASKEVKFGVDARDKMLRGVDILNNAVKVTANRGASTCKDGLRARNDVAMAACSSTSDVRPPTATDRKSVV